MLSGDVGRHLGPLLNMCGTIMKGQAEISNEVLEIKIRISEAEDFA